MSGNAAVDAEAEQHAAATVRVPLRRMWDASLTFDLIDDPLDNANNDQGPIFVGREELLGALVNAIGQPDRRGTYLVSGYRGVGKTSLIIQAIRLARSRLQGNGWQLLPVVLNVSEISASLEPPSTAESNPLQIDARRLLTALLRALRNRVPLRTTRKSDDSNALAEKILWAYQKAEATRYTETQQQRAESMDTTVRESRRAFHIPDIFKLVAAVALLSAVIVEGAALLGSVIDQLHVIAIGLVGLAVFSFQRSVVLTKNSTLAASASSELVRDNSVHQLESELKDILEGLYKEKQRRTIIILEELDKIDDQEGQQLDSVIRYFKNLFTQAPALFFFITDKTYYDLISKRIELARRQRSYAIEHTFFTHRLFISRPGIEECLQYLMAAFSQHEDSSRVEVIVKSQGNRVRRFEDMSPLEQVIRVLLFRSQDHFFDLKRQMRQFVRVGPAESWLESSEDMMPKSERALAAFQFLVEQKMLSYRFGGGNDYANEELRNCLFAVFEALGSSEPQQIMWFYPSLNSEGDPLPLSERRRIIEAVNSLIEELERGGAINRLSPEPGTVANGKLEERFLWRDQAAVSFAPVARLEPHEQALFDDLSRLAILAESLSQGRLQRRFGDIAAGAKALAEQISHRVQMMTRSPVAIPIEDALSRRREAEKEITPLLEPAFRAHQQRLTETYGLKLVPISKTTPPKVFASVLPASDSLPRQRVLLVYELFSQADREEFPLPQRPEELERLAVVNVVLDNRSEQAGGLPVEGWMASLFSEESNRRYLVRVPLHEDLEYDRLDDRWGERTADELRLAQVWCERETLPRVSSLSPGEAAGPYALHTSDQPPREMLSLNDLFFTWLRTNDDVLVWTSEVGPSSDAIEAFFAINRVDPIVLVPYGRPLLGSPERAMNDQVITSLTRLIAAGRIVFRIYDIGEFWYDLREHRFDGKVLVETVDTDWASPRLSLGREMGVSVMHLQSDEDHLMTVVRLVQGRYPDYAVSILRAPADAGNIDAVASLTVLLADPNPDEARKWRTRLAESENASAIFETARRLENGHPDDAIELYRPLAETGNRDAVASLTVLLADPNPDEARKWRTRLAESENASAIFETARRLENGHPDDAIELYRPLAETGNRDAVASLTVLLADPNPDEARKWRTRLAESENASAIFETARRLENGHPDDAIELYRPLAETGNRDAVASLTVLLADPNPDEARKWRTRLAESENASAIFETARRLENGHPDDAIELYRPLAETGNRDAVASLTVLLADPNPDEARKWRTRLAESENASAIFETARRLEDGHPDDAIELYRPLAETGNRDALGRLTVLLADRNPDEARKWRTRLDKA